MTIRSNGPSAYEVGKMGWELGFGIHIWPLPAAASAVAVETEGERYGCATDRLLAADV